MLICPNEIVVAEQNRQQFRFVVDSVERITANAIVNGRNTFGETQHNPDSIISGLVDSDGNTIEILEFINPKPIKATL